MNTDNRSRVIVEVTQVIPERRFAYGRCQGRPDIFIDFKNRAGGCDEGAIRPRTCLLGTLTVRGGKSSLVDFAPHVPAATAPPPVAAAAESLS